MTLSQFKWVAAFLILMFPVVIMAGNTHMPLRVFLFCLLGVIFVLFCLKVFLLLGQRITNLVLSKLPRSADETVLKILVWVAWAFLFCILAGCAFGGFLYILKIIGL